MIRVGSGASARELINGENMPVELYYYEGDTPNNSDVARVLIPAASAKVAYVTATTGLKKVRSGYSAVLINRPRPSHIFLLSHT